MPPSPPSLLPPSPLPDPELGPYLGDRGRLRAVDCRGLVAPNSSRFTLAVVDDFALLVPLLHTFPEVEPERSPSFRSAHDSELAPDAPPLPRQCRCRW